MDHTQVAFRTFACMSMCFDHVRSAEIVHRDTLSAVHM